MTGKSLLPRLGALADGMLLAATAAAQDKPAAPNAAPSATDASTRSVAEQADRLLEEVGAYIGSANEFAFPIGNWHDMWRESWMAGPSPTTNE